MSKRNAKKAAKSKVPAARRKDAPRPAKGRATVALAKTKPAVKRKVAGKKMAARAKERGGKALARPRHDPCGGMKKAAP